METSEKIACKEQNSSVRTLVCQVGGYYRYKVVHLYASHNIRQSNLWYGFDTQDYGASQDDSEIPARSQIP